MIGVLPVLILAVVAGGVVWYVTQAQARAPARDPGVGGTPDDPGVRVGIPGVGGEVGVRPAPTPDVGVTLRALAATGAVIKGVPGPDGGQRVGVWGHDINVLARYAHLGAGGRPASHVSIWLASGGALELPLVGNISGVKNLMGIVTDRPHHHGFGGPVAVTDWDAVVVAAGYACEPGFMGVRQC